MLLAAFLWCNSHLISVFGVSNENLGCPLSNFSKTYFSEQQIRPLEGGNHMCKMRKTVKMDLRKIVGISPPRFWICCSLSYFGVLTKKILAGAVGAHPVLPPGSKAPKTTFLPIFGVKNPEIQKFFFLQISLFVGPIDGVNNIFFSEVPYWLHNDI